MIEKEEKLSSNQFPKISVVTPSYNQGQFLEQTIVSVLGQGYPNLEYIVIDGGSTDNSAAIIKKYDSKIDFWVSEKDSGQSDAINKGFARATGDILCWLNSDDLHMPNSLFLMAELADLHKEAIYFGNCIHFENSAAELTCYGSNVIANNANHALKHIDYIIQPSSFWTRKAWEKNGSLSETNHFAFDWEWFLRAQVNNIELIPVESCLSMYRIHSSHKTGTGGKKRQDEIIEISKKYAGERVELLKLIQNEDLNFSGIHYKLIRLAMRNLRMFYTDNILLKRYKSSKYKKYSVKAIDEARSMLMV